MSYNLSEEDKKLLNSFKQKRVGDKPYEDGYFLNKISKTEETLTGSPKAYQIFRDSQENVWPVRQESKIMKSKNFSDFVISMTESV